MVDNHDSCFSKQSSVFLDVVLNGVGETRESNLTGYTKIELFQS